MNIHVLIFVQMCAFIFSSKYLTVDWEGLMIGSSLTFKEKVLQSGYTVISSAGVAGSGCELQLATFSPTLDVVTHCNFSHSW